MGTALICPSWATASRKPQWGAMNVTFILLGLVQSQVRLLQVEYRNIPFSFQKGLLMSKMKWNEIIVSGQNIYKLQMAWSFYKFPQPHCLLLGLLTWASLNKVQTHLLVEQMSSARV